MSINLRFAALALLALPLACDTDTSDLDDDLPMMFRADDDDDDGASCDPKLPTTAVNMSFTKKGHYEVLAGKEGLAYSEQPAQWREAFDLDVRLQTESLVLSMFERDVPQLEYCASACHELGLSHDGTGCLVDLKVGHTDASPKEGYLSPRWTMEVESAATVACNCY